MIKLLFYMILLAKIKNRHIFVAVKSIKELYSSNGVIVTTSEEELLDEDSLEEEDELLEVSGT